MLVKNIVEEDFVNYKLPSMFIATCFCDWKCCIEQNLDISICQNASISKQPNILISDSEIYERYISNPITKAIVIGGLEPFRQYDDVYNLIELFRSNDCYDTFVIYTGYDINEEPVKSKLNEIQSLTNRLNTESGKIEEVKTKAEVAVTSIKKKLQALNDGLGEEFNIFG